MLKLHAGVSNKVGLPGFSSASASCTIEAELDSSLLTDTAGFQIVVQRAYQSCEKAVQDQITRLTSDNAPSTRSALPDPTRSSAMSHHPVRRSHAPVCTPPYSRRAGGHCRSQRSSKPAHQGPDPEVDPNDPFRRNTAGSVAISAAVTS
jgi:hypothetical protein